MSIDYNALAASNGAGEAAKATVQSGRSIGSTTITVDTTTNWPTGTFIATTGTLPVGNGGTGRATSTTAYGVIAAGTTATGAQQTISPRIRQ